ncbi:RNA polymerase sigma factor [Thiohalophilus sp.]|uniref:RNA polymerase sigma factor n=1 Tax=Thiohalophilus sp. TaxID=3028392 RepID=UPI002ACE9A5C|nr:RNA polymerase sigma factor [Thiohalophilus sp.]MDZ7663007.1 RNA polymerase sigma factor [Thiohalophilus sp.]
MNGSSRQSAFDTAARELASPILHFIERSVGNRAVAEELQQETLLRMYKGLSSFAGRSSVKTWAFSIARRVVADYLRHPDRERSIVALDETEEPIDPEREIDQRLVESEMNECIRAVIETLPESYRSALLLHDLEGLSAVQTADVCECSVATAKIRIHRARHKLKDALAKQCDFYHDKESVFRCDRKA